MMFRSTRSLVAALGFVSLLVSAGIASAQPADTDEQGLDGETALTPVEAGADEDSGAAVDEPAVEPVAASGVEKPRKSKGIIIESEDKRFKTQVQARVQGRYTYEAFTGEGEKDSTAFAVQRARLTLKGHAFEKNIGYKFQTDFGKGGSVTLKDFFVDNDMGSFRVRAGQFKRPFSRAQINSSGRLAFVDRAITDKGFNAGRDLGVMVHNNFEKSPDLEWAVGVFNGPGDKAVDGSNIPDFLGPVLVARVGVNRNGIKGYSEADLEGGPLRFGVAASALSEFDADRDNSSALRAQVDYVVKSNGISSTGGFYLSTTQDDEDFADQTLDDIGFHLQAGYTANKMHHIGARFAMIFPQQEDDLGNTPDPDMEITAGYSMFKHKHGFKWQTDIGLSAADGVDLGDEVLVRTQLQLSF